MREIMPYAVWNGAVARFLPYDSLLASSLVFSQWPFKLEWLMGVVPIRDKKPPRLSQRASLEFRFEILTKKPLARTGCSSVRK